MATLSQRQHVGELKAAAAAVCGLLQLVSGHFPSPDMCLPVMVLEKAFTFQTQAATALAMSILLQ